MSFAIRTVDGVSIVDLAGEIDLYKSPEVRGEIGKLIGQKTKSLIINFERVSYIDSSGLATMIDAFQKLRAHGGKLILVGLATPVRSVFEVARLDKFFPIFEKEAEALASLNS